MPQSEQVSASKTPQSAGTPSAPTSRPNTPRSSQSAPPASANQRTSPRLQVTTNRSSASNSRTSRPPSNSAVILPRANASGVRQSVTSPGSSTSRPSSVKGPALQPVTSPKQANRGNEQISQQRPTTGKMANALENARRRSSSPVTSAEMRRLSSFFENMQRGSNQTQHALSHQKALVMASSPRMQSPRTSTSPRPTSLTGSHHPPSDTNTSASRANALNTIKERPNVQSSNTSAPKGRNLPPASTNPTVGRQQQRRSSVPQVFTAKRGLGARKRRTPLFRRSHSPAPRSSTVPPPSGSQAAALPSASEGAIITSVPPPSVPMSPPRAAPVQITPMTLSRVPIQVPTGRLVALPPRTTYLVPSSMATPPPWPTSGAPAATASPSIAPAEEATRFPRLVVYSSEAANPQPLEIIEWHVSESDLVVTCTPASLPTGQSVQAPQDPPVPQGGSTTREVSTQDATPLRNVSAQARISVPTNDVATNPHSANIRHARTPNTQACEMEEKRKTDVTGVKPLNGTKDKVKTPSATAKDVVSDHRSASGHDRKTVIPSTLHQLSNQETINERSTSCDPRSAAQLEASEVNLEENSNSTPLRRKTSTTNDTDESFKENKIFITEHKTPSNVITRKATDIKSDQILVNETNLNNKTCEKEDYNIRKINTMDYITEKVVDNVTSNTNNSVIYSILEEIADKNHSTHNDGTKGNNPLERTWSSEIQRKEDEISTTIIQYESNQVLTESEGNDSRKSVFSTPTLQTDNTRTGPTFFGPAGAVWYLSRWDTSAGETKTIHNGNDVPLKDVKNNNQGVPQEKSENVRCSENTEKESKFPDKRVSSNAMSSKGNLLTNTMETGKLTKNISDEIKGNGYLLKHMGKEERDTSLEKISTSPKLSSEYSKNDFLTTTCSSIHDSKSKIPRMKTGSVPSIAPSPLQKDENNLEHVSLKSTVNSIPSPDKINISQEQEKESFRQISSLLPIPYNTSKDLQHSEDESSFMTKVELYSPKTLNQQCSNATSLKSEEKEVQYFNQEPTSTWDQLFVNPSITSRVVPTTSLSTSKQMVDNHEESTNIPPLSYALIDNKEQPSTTTPCVLLTPPTPKESKVSMNNDIRPLLDAYRPATAPVIHDASTSNQSFVHKTKGLSDQVAKSNKNNDAKLITKTSTSPKAQISSSKECASTLSDNLADLKTNENSKPGTAIWSAPSQELGTISPHMVESSTTDSEYERMRIEELEKTLRFRLPTTSLATTIAKSEDSSSLIVKNNSKRTVAFAQSNSKTETLERRVEPDSLALGLLSESSHMHFAMVPNIFHNSRATESNNIPQKESPIFKQEDLGQDIVNSPITESAHLKTLSPGSSLIRYLPSENSNSVRRKNSNSPRIGGNLIKSILRLNSPEKNKETVSQHSSNIGGSPQIKDDQLNDQETPLKSRKGQSPDAQDDYARPFIKMALTRPRVAHFSEDILSSTGVKKDLGLFMENNQSMQQMLQSSFQEVLSDYSDLSSSMSKEQSHDDLSRDEALPSIHEESDLYTMGIKYLSSQSESSTGMIFNTSITVNSNEIKPAGIDSSTSNGEISSVEKTHSKTSPKFRLGRKRTPRRRTTSNSPKPKSNNTSIPGDSSPEKSPKAKRNLIHRVSDIFAKPFRRTKSSSSRSPSRNAKESPRKNVGRLLARQTRPPHSSS